MATPAVKIYGERNTGTNYLSDLINLNLQVKQLSGSAPVQVRKLQKLLPGRELIRDAYFSITTSRNLGWKHVLVNPLEMNCRLDNLLLPLAFITLTKNPYSWLLSMYNRPHSRQWRKKPSFEEFLTSSWKTVGRECAPRYFQDPVELWNRKNGAYIKLKQQQRTMTLRYEDLLEKPETILHEVSDTVSCQWKSTNFVNVNHSTKESDKDYAYYRTYYLQEQWKTLLSDLAIRIINKRLDDEVMDYFGYRKIAK